MENERDEKALYIRVDSFERVIYDAGWDQKERKKDTPKIIDEINDYFRSAHYQDREFLPLKGWRKNSV